MQHVTGPGCVLVSLRFGPKIGDDILITKRIAKDQTDCNIQFDLQSYIQEVVDGVNEANQKYNGKLEVAEIEVVPNDYPRVGQVKYSSFKLAEQLLNDSAT